MIIVISDVHLGYGRSNSESLRKFLEQCAEIDIEHFVILGDLMDFWRTNNAKVIVDYQNILGQIGRLEAKNVYYIPGNHDYLIHRLARRYPEHYPFKVSKKLVLEDGGTRFNFVHGYELEVLASLEPMTIELYEQFSDRMCFSQRVIGGFATWVWGLVENRNEITANVGQMRLPPHERSNFDRERALATSAGAYLVLGMHPGEKLVYGHTHKPFINEDKTVANTGSWVDEGPGDRPRNTYIRIEEGRMELRAFGKNPFP
ncbi:MAG TPA: UDP-2,3-diacylglucosamine diphosphatase [Methanocella sp.]|jgi:UDP-2,3-diacylglucosamine pyrophosphatase LpxH